MMIGSDPEFFIVNEDNKLIPSREILKNLKTSKHEDVSGKIKPDGILAEFNVAHSCCRDILIMNLNRIHETLNKHLKTFKYKVYNNSVFNIDQETFDNMSIDDKELGCKPDRNAYSGEENNIPFEKMDIPKRTCGGHIHIGLSTKIRQVKIDKFKIEKNKMLTIEKIKEILKNQSIDYMPTNDIICYQDRLTIRILDAIVGVTSVLLDNKQSQKERREFYGKAGDYRRTLYSAGSTGLEYRVLSNFWCFETYIASFITGLVKFSIYLLYYIYNGKETEKNIKLLKEYLNKSTTIRNCINNANKTTALKLFIKYIYPIIKNSYTSNIKYRLFPDKKSLQIFADLIKGIKSPFNQGWIRYCEYIIKNNNEIKGITISELKDYVNKK